MSGFDPKDRELTEEENILLRSGIRLINWLHKNEVNIIVLKGSAATPLRGFLREVWAGIGLPVESFPRIYSIGGLTPRSGTKGSEDAKALIEGLLSRKLQGKYKKLSAELQNPRNRICLVDEICQTGFGLNITKNAMSRHGRATVMSATLTTTGPNPDHPPDFLGGKVFSERLRTLASLRYVLERVDPANMAKSRKRVNETKTKRRTAERDLINLGKKAKSFRHLRHL